MNFRALFYTICIMITMNAIFIGLAFGLVLYPEIVGGILMTLLLIWIGYVIYDHISNKI